MSNYIKLENNDENNKLYNYIIEQNQTIQYELNDKLYFTEEINYFTNQLYEYYYNILNNLDYNKLILQRYEGYMTIELDPMILNIYLYDKILDMYKEIYPVNCKYLLKYTNRVYKIFNKLVKLVEDNINKLVNKLFKCNVTMYSDNIDFLKLSINKYNIKYFCINENDYRNQLYNKLLTINITIRNKNKIFFKFNKKK